MCLEVAFDIIEVPCDEFGGLKVNVASGGNINKLPMETLLIQVGVEITVAFASGSGANLEDTKPIDTHSFTPHKGIGDGVDNC